MKKVYQIRKLAVDVLLCGALAVHCDDGGVSRRLEKDYKRPINNNIENNSPIADNSKFPALLNGEEPPRDTPNYFEPKKMSAGAIAASVQTCLATSVKSEPLLAYQPDVLRKYCGCSADAMRKNKGRGEQFIPEKHSVTIKQAKVCSRFAIYSKATSGKSPFSASDYENSLAVEKTVLGCERTKKGEGYTTGSAIHFCACQIDAMRSHYPRIVFNPEEQVLCKRLTEYFEKYRSHMTHRQFNEMKETSSYNGSRK